MFEKIKSWLFSSATPKTKDIKGFRRYSNGVEEYNGYKRYSTSLPEYLRIMQEELDKTGEIYVHTRYWARGGGRDDELFQDIESFKKRAAENPPNANMTLMLGQTFLLEDLIDEDFIEKALHFPYTERYLLLVVEEKDVSKNRAYYAPNQPVINKEELKEYLEELKGQKAKIGLYSPWLKLEGIEEVLGYVPDKYGKIDFHGPY